MTHFHQLTDKTMNSRKVTSAFINNSKREQERRRHVGSISGRGAALTDSLRASLEWTPEELQLLEGCGFFWCQHAVLTKTLPVQRKHTLTNVSL